MEQIKWEQYYKSLESLMSPSEFLLKCLLGKYENKFDFLETNSWKTAFRGKKCLDAACGDGRNLVLLNKLGFSIFATELTSGICEKVKSNLLSAGICIDEERIKIDKNNHLPFEDDYFDFIVSWNAVYYLDDEHHEINANFKEAARCLAKGGYLICSVPGPDCYSVLGAEELGGNKVKLNPVVNSNWGGGIQNGSIYYLFRNKPELEETLKEDFCNIQISELRWDGFGVPLHYFIFLCQKI